MWQKLASNMASIIKYYQQMLVLNENKRKVLVVVDMKGLEQIVKDEQELVSKIEKAENTRQGILKVMAATDSTISPDIKMTDLLHKCPNPQQREQLHKLHQMLSKTVKDVQMASENNAIILKAALGAVNFRLNQLGGVSVESGYGNKGQEMVSHEKNFDFQA